MNLLGVGHGQGPAGEHLDLSGRGLGRAGRRRMRHRRSGLRRLAVLVHRRGSWGPVRLLGGPDGDAHSPVRSPAGDYVVGGGPKRSTRMWMLVGCHRRRHWQSIDRLVRIKNNILLMLMLVYHSKYRLVVHWHHGKTTGYHS